MSRLSSGVSGLDEMLSGGFLPGSAVLVRGAPGTGKTTLGLQYLRAGVAENEAGVFISFEEFPESLDRDAASLGWDLNAMQAGGALTVQFTSPEVLLASLQSGNSPFQQLIRQKNVRRLVLDSATHFARLARDEQDLRQIYAALVNALKREDLTALLLAEDRRRVAGGPGDGRLGFIVDGILLLRYLEIDSAIQRALVVLKLRGSPHSKEIRSVRIEAGSGLVVGKAFEGRRELLSGLAHQGLISSVR